MSTRETRNGKFPRYLRLVLPVAILVLLAYVVYGGDSTSEMVHEESAEGLSYVKVENINGEITVTGSKRKNVKVIAREEVEFRDSEVGMRFAEEFKPIIKRRGQTLKIETHRPDLKRSEQDEIKKSRMDYEILVPNSLGVLIETVNGDVVVKEVYGEIELETVNGDIEVTATRDLAEGLILETVNGGIDVVAKTVGDDCSFETVNGSIEATITEGVNGEIDAETVNGSVRLMLPENAGFSIDASCGPSGNVKTDWGKPSGVQVAGKSFQLDVNGGGNRVSAETVNGSVSIKRAKS